ncbi:MAG: type II toxin-antitoxin system VapB family antitoxin [Pyrinomonadaceae bacterium]
MASAIAYDIQPMMELTVSLDDELIKRAFEICRSDDLSVLVEEGLEILIENCQQRAAASLDHTSNTPRDVSEF